MLLVLWGWSLLMAGGSLLVVTASHVTLSKDRQSRSTNVMPGTDKHQATEKCLLSQGRRVARRLACGKYGCAVISQDKDGGSRTVTKVGIDPKRSCKAMKYESSINKRLGGSDHWPAARAVVDCDRGRICSLDFDVIDEPLELEKWIQKHNRGKELNRKLVKSVLKGVAVMHSRGVLHNDLHTENVLVVGGPDNPRAYLIDFGMSVPVPNRAMRRVAFVDYVFMLFWMTISTRAFQPLLWNACQAAVSLSGERGKVGKRTFAEAMLELGRYIKQWYPKRDRAGPSAIGNGWLDHFQDWYKGDVVGFLRWLRQPTDPTTYSYCNTDAVYWQQGADVRTDEELEKYRHRHTRRRGMITRDTPCGGLKTASPDAVYDEVDQWDVRRGNSAMRQATRA